MEPSAKTPTTYWEQIALLRNAKGLIRLLVYLAVIYFLTPFLLGLIFMAILFPLTLAVIRLAVVFPPAYHLAGRVMGVNGLPAHLAKPPTWYTIYSILYEALCLAVAAFFIRLLFFSGFCNQNPVCMLGHLLLK